MTEIKIGSNKVAAIAAALMIGGFLTEGQVITGIKREGEMSPWKKTGLMKQMLGRDLSIDSNILK